MKTSQGLLELIKAGTQLPFPSPEPLFHTDDRLLVPETSLVEPLPLRVEVVAGVDERPVYTAVWDLQPPVERGQGLTLMYRYDANQALWLKLRVGRAGQADEWHTALIENPLTNVVNPQPERESILELEQRIRSREIPEHRMPDVLVELADKYARLGQREKAIEHLQRALRRRRAPDAGVLNKMAMLYGEIGHVDREEELYREAARVSGWSGALFNLALAQRRRQDYKNAIESVELALAREEDPPYFVLRAMLARDSGDSEGKERYLNGALARFGPIELQSDWQLGWFLTALKMRGDMERAREVETELRRRRSASGSHEPDDEGFLPHVKRP